MRNHVFIGLTYSMKQSPSWEAKLFSASQEMLCILWNLKVHYYVYKCPPLVPIMSQINSTHDTPTYLLKIPSNIILPSRPGCSKWSPSLRFPHQNPVCHSPHPHKCYMTPHLILHDCFHWPICFKFYVTNSIWIQENCYAMHSQTLTTPLPTWCGRKVMRLIFF